MSLEKERKEDQSDGGRTRVNIDLPNSGYIETHTSHSTHEEMSGSDQIARLPKTEKNQKFLWDEVDLGEDELSRPGRRQPQIQQRIEAGGRSIKRTQPIENTRILDREINLGPGRRNWAQIKRGGKYKDLLEFGSNPSFHC